MSFTIGLGKLHLSPDKPKHMSLKSLDIELPRTIQIYVLSLGLVTSLTAKFEPKFTFKNAMSSHRTQRALFWPLRPADIATDLK